MKRKIKVLCFTDGSTGRDVEMMLPVRYYAEKFLNCEFVHYLNIDIHAIYKEKPDVIFQANTIGSNLYFVISKIAHDQGIPVFALISEGNFRTDGSFDYWGYNRDKKFYQDYICCWSERTAAFLKEKEKHYKNKIVVTGGVGFDRYSIYKFIDRNTFLEKHGLNRFTKVIGYAGWAFGKLCHPRGVSELLSYFKGDRSKLEWAEDQRIKVRDILKEAALKHPDTLFILKQHPQENSPERSEPVRNEMSELAGMDNVLYLCEEESIHDLISVSDFWTCFESTTALESWLMGKQTLFINPDPAFNRDPLFTGSPMTESFGGFEKAIESFYASGKIPGFDDENKRIKRDELIRNTIGFGDGLNHARAGYYFEKTLGKIQSPEFKPSCRFRLQYFIMFVLVRIGGLFYYRPLYSRMWKFKKHLWVFENYKLEKLHALYKKYSLYLDDFYKKENVLKKLDKIRNPE